MIRIRSTQRALPIASKLLARKAQKVLALLGLSRAEVSILLCGDRRMRRLNLHYRGVDRTTDVLSFPMWEKLPPTVGRVLLGDIVISAPKAAFQGRESGRSLGRELERLLVHGMLHLVGYDHERNPHQARKMRSKEREILKALQDRR